MRIVVWNCAMALHAKWDRLMSLRPDVAIVPECAGPAVLCKRRGAAEPCSFEWDGHNQNKGLGVFAFGEYTLARDARFDGGHQIFLRRLGLPRAAAFRCDPEVTLPDAPAQRHRLRSACATAQAQGAGRRRAVAGQADAFRTPGGG
jgi:hypothetical protein